MDREKKFCTKPSGKIRQSPQNAGEGFGLSFSFAPFIMKAKKKQKKSLLYHGRVVIY